MYLSSIKLNNPETLTNSTADEEPPPPAEDEEPPPADEEPPPPAEDEEPPPPAEDGEPPPPAEPEDHPDSHVNVDSNIADYLNAPSEHEQDAEHVD